MLRGCNLCIDSQQNLRKSGCKLDLKSTADPEESSSVMTFCVSVYDCDLVLLCHAVAHVWSYFRGRSRPLTAAARRKSGLLLTLKPSLHL